METERWIEEDEDSAMNFSKPFFCYVGWKSLCIRIGVMCDYKMGLQAYN